VQTVFLLLFVAAILFRRSIRRYLQSIEQRLTGPAQRYRLLVLVLLRRSFLLLCAAAILLLYDVLKLPHMNFSLARFLNQAVLTLLAVRWGIDFVHRDLAFRGTVLLGFVQGRLVQFLQWLRLLVIAYLALGWVAGSDSPLVGLARLVLESALLVWVVVFWRRMRARMAEGLPQSENAPSRSRLLLVWSIGYLVAGGALLMELVGYRVLAGHWLVSWAQTLLLGMWAHLGWQVIQEWYTEQKAAPRSDAETGLPAVAAPVGWFLVQMTRLVWIGAIAAGALLIWSSRAVTTGTLTQVFNLAFAVGSLTFSVKGLLLSVVILCATHVATRIGRRLLREKILSGRDFERGLKDSIVTITSYVMWGLGLVLTLGVLGVNATSLAVVFGALSIGIGFGLQNIFNNFISGLILLFERPIQVGDYVEVGGLWAEVKQINVRSTIVQTFDNAAVIIPNSEFISQQVTNWSFKDPRMRRQVDVGVAYGSDIELVRDTLLDIAANTPQVLNYPKPDVLFLDHADSALIFRLRYWAHVDNYYSTSTAIRFTLDRRFRELGIEIAFPQRDLHIRSAPAHLFATGKDAAASTPPPSESPQADS
jgi:small-conductance mechanosensitive channel